MQPRVDLSSASLWDARCSRSLNDGQVGPAAPSQAPPTSAEAAASRLIGASWRLHVGKKSERSALTENRMPRAVNWQSLETRLLLRLRPRFRPPLRPRLERRGNRGSFERPSACQAPSCSEHKQRTTTAPPEAQPSDRRCSGDACSPLLRRSGHDAACSDSRTDQENEPEND